MTDEQKPLEGITVVSLSQVLSGPFGSMMLADFGAEVIKIEAVGRGDVSRSIHPVPRYFDVVNRNKKSIGIDLKTEEGQEVAHEILANADVFIENMKPGRPDNFNIGYEDIKDINNNIIYCSLKGFGSDSPYEDLPATDYLIQAASGMMSMTGENDGAPAWSGLPVGDLVASMYAVDGILTALYAREKGDIESEFIEVSMLDTVISWLTSRAAYTFGTGSPFPRGVHPGIAPQAVFETEDENLAVAAGTDGLWPSFCEAIDRPDLIEDERFDSQDNRVENREALHSEIQSEMSKRPAEEWLEIFMEAAVPVVPLHDTKTVWEDEHVVRHGLRKEMECDGRDNAVVIDNPLRFENINSELQSPPPKLGQHTDELLEELGINEGRIAQLRSDDVVE